jgi:hypothetical protein
MSRFNCKVVKAVPVFLEQRYNPRYSQRYNPIHEWRYFIVYKIRDIIKGKEISYSQFLQYKDTFDLVPKNDSETHLEWYVKQKENG